MSFFDILLEKECQKIEENTELLPDQKVKQYKLLLSLIHFYSSQYKKIIEKIRQIRQ